MKRFLIASAVVTLLALPPVLQATGTAATNPYVARYSLDYYRNDPVPLTALEIRRIEKAAALYARTGTITILPARVAPKAPAPVVSAAPASTNCVPAGSAPAIAPLAAPAPAAIIGPSDLDLRRQAKADAAVRAHRHQDRTPGSHDMRPGWQHPWSRLSQFRRACLASKRRSLPRLSEHGLAPNSAGRWPSRSSRGRCSGRRSPSAATWDDAGAGARHAGPARSWPARPRPLPQEIRQDRSLIFRLTTRRLSEATAG